jgi:peptidoglycan-associated lipoprotein
MKIKGMQLAIAVVAITILTACSSKKDTITYNDKNVTKKVERIEPKKVEEAVDRKLSSIQTIDTNSQDDTISNVHENTYINEVNSVINGETHTLTSIHFGFDNYKMRDEMITISNENADKISKVFNANSNVKVKLEGSCDEWGSDEYNFALGLKRAKTVKTSLINSGIKSSNIIIVSLGESNPLCKDHTAKCWKKNRRVDHKLLP